MKAVTPLLSLLSVSGDGRWTRDPSEPAAAHPPGARRAAVRGPPGPPGDLFAKQYEQPGPLSGLAVGNPADVASRSEIFESVSDPFCVFWGPHFFTFLQETLITLLELIVLIERSFVLVGLGRRKINSVLAVIKSFFLRIKGDIDLYAVGLLFDQFSCRSH